jgi:signal transduction histidine kinase
VERPRVIIISDDRGFPGAITSRWMNKPSVPTFSILEANACSRLKAAGFDLAIVGHVGSEMLASVMKALDPARKPVILVSTMDGRDPQHHGVIVLPETFEWLDVLLVLAQQMLQRERAVAELEEVQEGKSYLEHQASLGRYMLEMRPNVNNALTSILGNSDLILLDESGLQPALRSQVETIRNMGMRMNEIMQRFSSLQKEMELVEEQHRKKAAKAAVGS